MTLFIDQIQGRPVAVLVSAPGAALVIHRHSVFNLQVPNRFPEVVYILFITEFWIMVAYNNQSLIGVRLMPAPQRGDYVAAVNSTKGPHFQQHDAAAQFGQTQRSIDVYPDLVGQFRCRTQIIQGRPHC